MKWYEDPVYHVMCEKAAEVQNFYFEYNCGDWVLCRGKIMCLALWEDNSLVKKDDVWVTMTTDTGCLSIRVRYNVKMVWLPRQDQLQDMVIKQGQSYLSLHKGFHWFVDTQEEILGIEILKISMEQLWLAFVMKTEFGKIWNGNDWESE